MSGNEEENQTGRITQGRPDSGDHLADDIIPLPSGAGSTDPEVLEQRELARAANLDAEYTDQSTQIAEESRQSTPNTPAADEMLDPWAAATPHHNSSDNALSGAQPIESQTDRSNLEDKDANLDPWAVTTTIQQDSLPQANEEIIYDLPGPTATDAREDESIDPWAVDPTESQSNLNPEKNSEPATEESDQNSKSGDSKNVQDEWIDPWAAAAVKPATTTQSLALEKTSTQDSNTGQSSDLDLYLTDDEIASDLLEGSPALPDASLASKIPRMPISTGKPSPNSDTIKTPPIAPTEARTTPTQRPANYQALQLREDPQVAIQRIFEERKEKIIKYFYEALLTAQMEPSGDILICPSYFMPPLGKDDEQRIELEIKTINEHLLKNPLGDREGHWGVAVSHNSAGDLDLIIKSLQTSLAKTTGKMATRFKSVGGKFKGFKGKATPILIGIGVASLPFIIPRVKRWFKNFMIKRQLGQYKNITAIVIQDIFDRESKITSEFIQMILSQINKIATQKDKNLSIGGEIQLKSRGTLLRLSHADSHGRISQLDQYGIHIAMNLFRGETLVIETNAGNQKIKHIFLSNGRLLQENLDWYDFNQINKRTLDKRSAFGIGREWMLGLLGLILGYSSRSFFVDSFSTGIVLAGLAVVSLLVAGSFLYNRLKKLDQTRDILMKTFMEYRASHEGMDFEKVHANARGAVPALEKLKIFLFEYLQPGEEIYIERNENSEVINVFDMEGKDVFFFDYGRRFYLDVEELEIRVPLIIRILLMGAISVFSVTSIMLVFNAPLMDQIAFPVSLALLVGAGALYLRSFLRNHRKKVVLGHILARLKRRLTADEQTAEANLHKIKDPTTRGDRPLFSSDLPRLPGDN